MILKNIHFFRSYSPSIKAIETIRKINPRLEQELNRIEYYLKELLELNEICEENGIPDVLDLY